MTSLIDRIPTNPTAPTAWVGTSPRRTRPDPRRVRKFRSDDWFCLVGSVVASLSLVTVVYEHILDGSGTLGFLLTWYGTFLVLYGITVAVTNNRFVVVDRLACSVAYGAAAVVLFALGSTVVYTFLQGRHALAHLNFFTHTMAGVAPTAPLSKGGMLQALVGTVVEVAIAAGVSVPLGIGTAVYMTEVGGRAATMVRTVVEAMTALPEILAGLFVYVFLIVEFHVPKSGIAVSAAMTVTMVPIVARAGEVALRVVPDGLREASSALGATQGKTVFRVVLPTAASGLATAAILSVARGIGETAVPLITSGASSFLNFDPVKNPMNSLPLYIYTAYTTHQPAEIERAFGAASVLLTMILMLFAAIRFAVRPNRRTDRRPVLRRLAKWHW